ncbi:thioredoxin-like protein [Agrocybe pediades]|nr:thioredoxin-like protein [Agrocybe pediades]
MTGGSTLIESREDLRRILLRRNLTCVVMFYLSWSMQCLSMRPVFDQIASSGEYERWLHFYHIDCDNAPDIVTRTGPYGIEEVPTFIIWRDGRELARKQGPTIPELKELLDRAKPQQTYQYPQQIIPY